MRRTKLLAGLAAAAMVAGMSMLPMNVSAAEVKYTPITIDNIEFEKFLAMKKAASVPEIDFTFSVEPISADEAIKGTSTTMAVIPGPETIKFVKPDDAKEPAVKTVSFDSTDETVNESEAPERGVHFNTAATDDEKFAAEKLTLDMSAVSFTAPGVYRYKVTETPSSAVAGITNDTNTVRYLNIIIQDDKGELKYVYHYFQTDTAAPKLGENVTIETKSKGFTNYYSTNDLAFAKTVEGNQGSKEQYFKFTVKLDAEDINEADKYVLAGNWDKEPEQTVLTAYTADDMKAANNIEYLTYADLKGNGHSFYLKHGQQIAIQGIPAGVSYSVEEVYEDYTPSAVMSDATVGDRNTGDAEGEGTPIAAEQDKTAKTVTLSDTYMKGDATALFTNSKNGTIPTGVLSAVAPSASLAVIGLIGVAGGAVYLKKKKSEEE